jgi:hypothetical protein
MLLYIFSRFWLLFILVADNGVLELGRILRTTLATCYLPSLLGHCSQENHLFTKLLIYPEQRLMGDLVSQCLIVVNFHVALYVFRLVSLCPSSYCYMGKANFCHTCVDQLEIVVCNIALQKSMTLTRWRRSQGPVVQACVSKAVSSPAKFVCSDLLRSPLREYIILEPNTLVCGVSPSLTAHVDHD